MVRIKEKNPNTQETWDGLHKDPMPHNLSIARQFDRFFSLGLIPTDKIISILDVGCGNALHFGELSKKYPLISWHGVDISLTVVHNNRDKFPNATYHHLNIDEQPLPEIYDYIVSMHTFEHLEDPVAALEKCINHAREKVIICVPFDDHWGSDPTHVHKFTLDDPFKNYLVHHMLNSEEITFVFEGKANA